MEEITVFFGFRAKTTSYSAVVTLNLSGHQFWVAVVKNLTALRPWSCHLINIIAR